LRLATVSISENFRRGVDIEDGFYIGPTFIIRTSPPAIVMVIDADFHAGVNFAITEFSRSSLPEIATWIATWQKTHPLCPFILALVS
jgi:hypothetical protein